MTLRGRLIALACGATVILAAGIADLVGSRTPGCTIAAPRPSLPAELRALGDFDQAYGSTDVASLEDAAVRAAGALHGDLIGAQALAPVTLAAMAPGAPTAMVVPLRAPPAAGQPAVLDGLAVFLLDCQSDAYFSAVEDDATTQPPLTAFPPVDRATAAAHLGGGVRLAYRSDPLHPLWLSTGQGGSSLPAR